jgi:hypothetical protein
MSEFVVTDVAFAEVELSIEAVDGEAVGGSEYVWVCVGGCCRYGICERTLCSA